jgi:serine/threonine protein kinase
MSIARRRFRIIKEIAEGGFGKVYLAEQISSDGFSRIVAIKLLHAKWSSHDEVVKRTRDEARVLGKIRHQHIVKVEDLTSIESKCAIVMEYLEGVDLKWMMTFLKERKLEFSRAALFEIVLAVASALDAAYNSVPLQGDQPLRAIHRDIKPSNIFVTVAGGVKVLDFGTARANFAEREAKTQALAFGSQGYMAPERMLGEEDTPAADIFSLGITLYELLTLDSFGRIPPRPNKFQKKVEERVAAVPLKGEDDWVTQVRDTLRLMLSYAPADRPTAAQLVEIMDLLAQEANDTGLRRYCRTVVAEAKDALPALDTGDALCGTIVDEDDSVVHPPAGSGDSTTSFAQMTLPPPTTGETPRPPVTNQTPGPSSLYGTSQANTPASVNRSGSGSRPMGRAPPAPSTEFVSSPVTPPAAPPAPALDNVRTVDPGAPKSIGIGLNRPVSPAEPPPDTSMPPRPPSGGGSKKLVVAAGVVVLLLLLLGGGSFVALGGVAILYSMFGGSGEISTDLPPPTDGQPTGDDDAGNGTGPAGGKILTPDTRADAKRVPTVLKFSDPAGGSVKIQGPSGFSAEWDGKSDFDLGPTGDGKYRATVTTPTATHRLKTFAVDGTKKTCAFTFDLPTGEWKGGCE